MHGLCTGKLLIREIGVEPDRLLRVDLLHVFGEVHKATLVLGLHRLIAERREAVHIEGLYALDGGVLDVFRERLAGREFPGHFVEAERAVPLAAGNEERRPHAGTVRTVAVFDLGVVHPPASPLHSLLSYPSRLCRQEHASAAEYKKSGDRPPGLSPHQV